MLSNLELAIATVLGDGGTATLGTRIRKLSQDSFNLLILESPFRVCPPIRRTRRTSLSIVELVQPPQQLLVRPHCEDKIDPIWGIEIARLKSERSGSKSSGHPTRPTRVKYGTDSG